MLFSSATFLYMFLPVVLTVYFLSPKRFKNGVLLLSSLFFYGWGEPKYIVLMVVSIISGYISGLLIEHQKKPAFRKLFLFSSLAFGLGLLGYFKYADFFAQNLNSVTGLLIPLPKIMLPIGISFYTFQISSYSIDVYRRDTKAQKNLISFAAYVVLFPQLIAGPIVRYADIAYELENRSSTLENTYSGLGRFIVGLSKKVVLANTLGELCVLFRNSDDKSVLFYWIFAAAFTMQVYFDFSGYSDMAIGLGKVFGFNFLENFNYPLISKTISEFWRRWHMSLGSWFRDYLYIPLGGNRVSKPRWLFNITVVWALTGLWHGAAWNFVLWGMIFAVLLVFEKFWFGNIIKKAPSFISHLYVLFFILISFVIFNASSGTEVINDLRGLFGIGGIPFISLDTIYYLNSFGVILILAAIFSTPIPKNIKAFIVSKPLGETIVNIAYPITLILLFLLVNAYLISGSYNPFLYFRF